MNSFFLLFFGTFFSSFFKVPSEIKGGVSPTLIYMLENFSRGTESSIGKEGSRISI